MSDDPPDDYVRKCPTCGEYDCVFDAIIREQAYE